MKKGTKFLIGAGAVGGAYLGLLNVVDNLLVRKSWTLPRGLSDKIANADMSELDRKRIEFQKTLETYSPERHCIINDRGEKLNGWLYKSESGSNVYVLCAHGYRSCGKDEYAGIAQYYIRRGFNVLLVDHTASGDSEGSKIGYGYFEAKDCIKWIEYLNENFGSDIIVTLHGVSMGAATVMLMSGDESLPENVKLVVVDCGYTSAAAEFEFKLKEMKIDKLPGILPIVNSINKITNGYDFYDTDAKAAVAKAKIPMLFIHGGADEFVPTFMGKENYEACSSEIKDILIIDGADHAQSYITDQTAYEAKLDEFFRRALKI